MTFAHDVGREVCRVHSPIGPWSRPAEAIAARTCLRRVRLYVWLLCAMLRSICGAAKPTKTWTPIARRPTVCQGPPQTFTPRSVLLTSRYPAERTHHFCNAHGHRHHHTDANGHVKIMTASTSDDTRLRIEQMLVIGRSVELVSNEPWDRASLPAGLLLCNGMQRLSLCA